MRGIGYIFRVWFSALLLTPIIYILLLSLLSGLRFPSAASSVIITFVIPYALLISGWTVLALLTVINLMENRRQLKVYLSITGFLMPFAALTMVHHISALLSYNGNYLLALAYAFSTAIFVLAYKFNVSDNNSAPIDLCKSAKNAVIYSSAVWVFTFLFSTPVSIIIWIMTKNFTPISPIKTALDIIDRYNIQLSLSIAYFITIILTALMVINLDISEYKRKAIILFFAFPLTFPVLFYYLLFSGELFTYKLLEILSLILPSMIVSALSILAVEIIPKANASD